ncbi:hypothetical protein DFJ73DRAFT_559793 [Zopfochytrium polystomum]|nr:hypothetical protein DFJ73DRAFT_559793 [Zopfochytrium polystomum]
MSSWRTASSQGIGSGGCQPSWIYHAIVLKSLPKPEFHSPDPAQFMSGVIVAATDTIPPNDRACIFGGVLAFGGDYRERLAPDVTHLVALDTTGETYALAERRIRRQNLLAAAAQVATAPLSSSTAPSSSLLQIVLPHYFDDCLRIRRRVREDLYRLPNPKLFSIDPFAPPVFEPAATHSAPSTAANAFFLEGQVLFVHPGVWATESDPDRTKQLKEQIVAAGGLLVDEFDGERVTGAVVPSRQCKEYYLAEKAGKYVGSMRWLVDTINSRQLSSPRRKALHYPQPEPLAEFQHFMICTTNYSSVARQDIMTMVVHLGGQFTKTMTPRNTHVICAKPVSEKYTRALEWDITVVNHLWLEDTYVSHRLQIPTRLHYLYFPASLCPIVGETSIAEKEVVRSIAFFEAVHAVGIVNEKSVAASTDDVESDPLVDGGEDAGGPGKTPRLKSAGEGGASGSGGRRKIGLVVAKLVYGGRRRFRRVRQKRWCGGKGGRSFSIRPCRGGECVDAGTAAYEYKNSAPLRGQHSRERGSESDAGPKHGNERAGIERSSRTM